MVPGLKLRNVNDQPGGRRQGYSLARHIKLHESLDLLAGALVRSRNGLGAKETTLLSSIPVELNRVGWLEACREQDAEALEQIDAASTVVISTWCATACWVAQVDRVHVGANDDNGSRWVASWNLGNDRRLDEAVRIKRDRDVGATICTCVLFVVSIGDI